jgi:hypothetical protein
LGKTPTGLLFIPSIVFEMRFFQGTSTISVSIRMPIQ